VVRLSEHMIEPPIFLAPGQKSGTDFECVAHSKIAIISAAFDIWWESVFDSTSVFFFFFFLYLSGVQWFSDS
jgi:hypothetical protein